MALNEKIVSDIAEKLGMPEVLEQFRSAETPAAEVNPFAEALTGIHVFGGTQLDERINNEKAAAALEAKNTATGNAYGAMDSRILTETGIAKNQGEKTADYLVRAAKEKFGKPGNESDEIKALREDVRAKTELLTQKNTELETMKTTHASEQKQTQINSRLDAAINSLAIDAPADRIDSQREFVKFKLMQKYEADVVDGKVVFKDKASGVVAKDTTTASPLTEAALIVQFAPTVVSLKKTSQKRGTGVDDTSHNDAEDNENFGAFPNLDAYKKHLSDNGITTISQKGQDLIAKYIAHRDKPKNK